MNSPRHHQRPFAHDPARWEKEHARAQRTGHFQDSTCQAACELVLVYERTPWGWLAWTVPGDGSPPEIPHQIGVLAPAATRMQRLAVRCLTRRTAWRIAADTALGSLRCSTAAVALVSLLIGLFALSHGAPAEIALPSMLLVPLLAEHLPDRLDDHARAYVRSAEGDSACRYMQRIAALHTSLIQAADGSDRYQLRRSAEIGHNLLWDAAGLLQTQDTRSASADLIACERLMLQLAHEVAEILKHTAQETSDADQASGSARPSGSAGTAPATHPAPRHRANPLLQKGIFPMLQPDPSRAVRSADVYLLFAHEPYHPAGVQEINTTVVASSSLLHHRVRQPDGARIHRLLVRGRRPGEIVPLSTLTHELDGGARWPEVGDWEAVTTDLLQLVRDNDCDALNLSLPDIERALACAGPHSEVRVIDPTSGAHHTYGPADRIEVLIEVGRHLAWAEAGSPLWPGDDLLAPLD
ncbi:hypothetical protein AB5J52_48190 (plasmid) [Streptomyces sp. R39]|uniref:Uncharacterized protein n=1 Tax=Streptomyces sp. R39 TaxID=3238631 RepID=A0AB39R4S8_9ACTN